MSIQTLNPRRSGTDELEERARRPVRHRPRLVRADEATLNKYAATLHGIELWQHVMLYHWADCDLLGRDAFGQLMRGYRLLSPQLRRMLFGPETAEETLCRTAQHAWRALRSGGLKPAMPSEWVRHLGFDTWIELSEFRRWAAKVKLPMVDPWPQRNADAADWTALRFPHSTSGLELLEKLARRGQEEAQGIWPTNERMSDLAVELGASRNLADLMACLLRPDGLRRGRRPGH